MTEGQTVPLYRVENPHHPSPRKPDGVVSHEDLVGRWFSPNLPTALRYLRKSTLTSGRDAGPVNGAQLAVARIPVEQLDVYHVSRHPVAATMDVEGDNYLIPRDGTVPIDTVPLDEILGDLRGHLGDIRKYSEASQRIHAALGLIAVEE